MSLPHNEQHPSAVSQHTHFNIYIHGVPILFPFAPYRAQNMLMQTVVRSIKHKENALIESPTGTGKTVALLCSALATQQQSKTWDNQFNESMLHESHSPIISTPNSPIYKDVAGSQLDITPNAYLSDDSDFQTSKRPKLGIHSAGSSNNNNISREKKLRRVKIEENISFDSCRTSYPFRVFYCSRTHTQLSQVSKDLFNTIYRPSMTVLGSRKEYCINESVNKSNRRDLICHELVSRNACPYNRNVSAITDSMPSENIPWDIEDLISLGSDLCSCPYYGSRILYKEANLILCPYNYLLDPIIRRSKGIDFDGDVIIFDEAHNIDSLARDVLSCTIDYHQLQNSIEYLGTIFSSSNIIENVMVTAFKSVQNLHYCLLQLADQAINHTEVKSYGEYDLGIFENDEMINLLDISGVCMSKMLYWRTGHDFLSYYGDGKESKRQERLEKYKPVVHDEELEDFCGSSSQEKEKDTMQNNGNDENNLAEAQDCKTSLNEALKSLRPKLNHNLNITDRALMVLQFLFQNRKDYILLVRRDIKPFETKTSIMLQSMNGSLALQALSQRCRSIIVTSGTLTPLHPFASELGLWFTHMKSLPHVIDNRKQLYVAVQPKGRDDVILDASYRFSCKFEYQDSLGDTISDYFRVIPHGLLVFFPSYRLMHLLLDRWKSTSIFSLMEKIKGRIFIEEKPSSENYSRCSKDLLQQYSQRCQTRQGAALFAVCRGRYSEGVDLRNEMSRAVFLIGIPYPKVNDPLVKCKMSWNDRTFLNFQLDDYSGRAWYQTQALRACNQALGRGIRHSFDYCSMILLDHRFRDPQVLSNLPSWIVKSILNDNSRHSDILREVTIFHEKHSSKVGCA